MKLFIPLWIAEAVFAALFMVAGHPISTKKGFGFKMVACALYLGNALYAFSLSAKTAFGVTILIGILGGLIGDVFLSIDPLIREKHSKKAVFTCFLFGGLFFLGGHIAYLTAFLRLLLEADAFRFLPFAALCGGLLLIFALLLRITDIHAGKYTLPVAIYACGLCCMFALSVCTALFVTANQPILQAILIAAPILFVASDVTLAMKTADRKRFGSLGFRVFSLSTYFLAQMLFGISILLQ